MPSWGEREEDLGSSSSAKKSVSLATAESSIVRATGILQR